jgi:uncharacterized protein (DUF488 family)
LQILTIGHSTTPIERFIQILQAHQVTHLGDIRTIARSRHNPQFNSDTLPKSLRAHGIGWTHMQALGGLRHPRRDSPNTGWRNSSFRGYADYMQTAEFENGLAALIEAGEREQIAIMCAEAVPWRCHRSLIADALTARQIAVAHILGPGPAKPHVLTPFAKVQGVQVTYPAQF